MLECTASNIAASIEHLNGEKAERATNINDALLDALRLIETDCIAVDGDSKADTPGFWMNQVLLITDGEPNTGVRNTTQIIANHLLLRRGQRWQRFSLDT